MDDLTKFVIEHILQYFIHKINSKYYTFDQINLGHQYHFHYDVARFIDKIYWLRFQLTWS